ncbi:MAG: hypothetical protein U0R71_00035, partial [Solirubrobacterales bacterium]
AELDAEQRRWREEHGRLKRECEGLDARALHLRERLPVPEREVIQVTAPPPIAPALLPEPSPEWPVRLRELAGLLADQRNHLAEQWRGLLQTQQQWQEERLAALAELEQASEQLGRRERDVAAAEDRARALERRRAELEAWQARLALEQSDWQARRGELQADLDGRERLVRRQSQDLEMALAEHKRQSQVELSELRSARARCEEARRQAAGLWGECDRHRDELAEQRRQLAAESIALERLRCELAHQSPDAGRAEARLEKISRRELTGLEAAARAVEADRDELRRWREELDGEAHRLGRLEDELLARRDELSRQAEASRARRVDAEAEDARREAEVWRLRARQALDERQLRQLHDEVERLARSLIDDEPLPSREAA